MKAACNGRPCLQICLLYVHLALIFDNNLVRKVVLCFRHGINELVYINDFGVELLSCRYNTFSISVRDNLTFHSNIREKLMFCGAIARSSGFGPHNLVIPHPRKTSILAGMKPRRCFRYFRCVHDVRRASCNRKRVNA